MFRCHYRYKSFKRFENKTPKRSQISYCNNLFGHHSLSKLLDHTLKSTWFEAQANSDLAVFAFEAEVKQWTLK